MSKSKQKTRVTETLDDINRISPNEKPWRIRTIHVEQSDEGFCTFQVRPWCGSVEIRFNGEKLHIDTIAVPALIEALKAAYKESLT